MKRKIEMKIADQTEVGPTPQLAGLWASEKVVRDVLLFLIGVLVLFAGSGGIEHAARIAALIAK